MDSYTGPWKVCSKAKGSSYILEHMDTGKPGKRHAAHLSPYPNELLLFMPVDDPSNQYVQMYAPISKDPYNNAGIKGFEACQPYVSFACPVIPSPDEDIQFPLLDELNADCFEWDKGGEEMILADRLLYNSIKVFAAALTPQPPTQAPPSPHVPDVII